MVTARTLPELRPRTLRREGPDRELCDVLALVGHELRSPLTTLGAALDLLEEDTGAPDAAFLLSRARREVRRLRLLFEASMRSTELVMRPSELSRGECDVPETLGRLLADLNPTDYGVKVEATIEPGLTAAIDSSALTIVVHNLLANAFRHAKADTVSLVARLEDGDVVVNVSDDGVGFSTGRADSNGAGLGSSGGLGLFVVERLLGRFGGTLVVHSVPGEGTACSVRIPEAVS
jgi:signal transduction histidine kinase